MGPRIYPSQQDTNLTAKGSLIFSLDQYIDGYSLDNIEITVNGILRLKEYNEVTGLYGTFLNNNDVVVLNVTSTNPLRKIINVNRRDYTTDDNNGDYGIVDISYTGATGDTTSYSLTFTAITASNSYNFEYRIFAQTFDIPNCSISGEVFRNSFFNDIIQSGLTIWTNGNSYDSASGVTWTDVMGNYNGIRVGSPSSNRPIYYTGWTGYFDILGPLTSYFQFPVESLGANDIGITFGGWAMINPRYYDQTIFSRAIDINVGGWSLKIAVNSSNQYYASVVAGTTLYPPTAYDSNNFFEYPCTTSTNVVWNQWVYLVGVWTPNTSLKFYINGILQNTVSAPQPYLRPSYFPGIGWMIGINNLATVFSDMKCADFEVYYRSLSDAEVLSNYNVNKSLFGY
jgi:hypothetical protein